MTDFNLKKFSKAISDFRKENNISLRKASMQIGISGTTIHRLEKGNSFYPDIVSFNKICQWIGMDMNDFFKA